VFKLTWSISSRNENFDAVAVLVEYHSDVNAQSNIGSTAVMCACFYVHIEVVEFLMQNNVQLKLRSDITWNLRAATILSAIFFFTREVIRTLMSIPYTLLHDFYKIRN
jgi:ankyrin repeat protein